MSYALLALLLLAGFVGLSLDSPQSVRSDSLTASEQNLRLRVLNPSLRRFGEDGVLESTLQAPQASDYGTTRPAQVSQPQMQWPDRGWIAQGQRGEMTPEQTRLIGDAQAQQPLTQRQLNAPQITQTGDLLVADQGIMRSPDFTGQAEQVTINTRTQVVTLTDQVETRLWPAR